MTFELNASVSYAVCCIHTSSTMHKRRSSDVFGDFCDQNPGEYNRNSWARSLHEKDGMK